jgi:hypothetical protein
MSAISDFVEGELSRSFEKSQSPMISVVIPHYNDFENLTRCLGSVRRQNFLRGQFEIVRIG